MKKQTKIFNLAPENAGNGMSELLKLEIFSCPPPPPQLDNNQN